MARSPTRPAGARPALVRPPGASPSKPGASPSKHGAPPKKPGIIATRTAKSGPRSPSGHVTFLGSFPDAPPPPTLPEVAFAGRSNVGKSSAINKLLNVGGLARVSKTPGRTQALNLFEVDERWIAVDLPGYGHANVSHKTRGAWKGLIERYLGERETLKLVVVLIDARLPPQEADATLIRGLVDARIPVLALATKADGIPRSKRTHVLTELARGHLLPPEKLLGFSSTEDIGLADARSAIEAAIQQ